MNKDVDGLFIYGVNNENLIKIGDGGCVGGVWVYRSIDVLKVKMLILKEYWDDIVKVLYFYSKEIGEFYIYDNMCLIGYKV